jgi:ABC transport system ATP-binding/permease protein
VVVGLDGGEGGIFADYSQWEAWREEQQEAKAAPKEQRAAPGTASPKKKLSYIEQREWDAMEEKILEAEQAVARWQHEMQESASDAKRLTEAYDNLQEAQRRVEDLYARWAELETKVSK